MKWFPSGRNAGQYWPMVSGGTETPGIAAGDPPFSDTFLNMPPKLLKTMTPRDDQDPPMPNAPTWQMSVTMPPETSSFFNRSLVKYPTERLSGDQKGWLTSSLPAMGCASSASIRLSHNWCLPSRIETTARNLPSGEIAAGCVRFAQKPSPVGGRMAARSWTGWVSDFRQRNNPATNRPTSTTSAATRSLGHH
jgi:hypothetical protein